MEMPVLDSEYLRRLGFTQTTWGELGWFKRVAQGSVWVDAKTGLGSFKTARKGVLLSLKFRTITQIKWFLDCLK